MEDTNLHTLPLEMQQSIFKFLSTLDKVHVSFISNSCAQAVFSEPDYLKEKTETHKNNEIKKFVTVFNQNLIDYRYLHIKSHGNPQGFIFFCNKITIENIKYIDNNVVLIRIDRPVISRNQFLIQLQHREIYQLNAKEINALSSYSTYAVSQENEVIDSLKSTANSTLNFKI